MQRWELSSSSARGLRSLSDFVVLHRVYGSFSEQRFGVTTERHSRVPMTVATKQPCRASLHWLIAAHFQAAVATQLLLGSNRPRKHKDSANHCFWYPPHIGYVYVVFWTLFWKASFKGVVNADRSEHPSGDVLFCRDVGSFRFLPSNSMISPQGIT